MSLWFLLKLNRPLLIPVAKAWLVFRLHTSIIYRLRVIAGSYLWVDCWGRYPYYLKKADCVWSELPLRAFFYYKLYRLRYLFFLKKVFLSLKNKRTITLNFVERDGLDYRPSKKLTNRLES